MSSTCLNLQPYSSESAVTKLLNLPRQNARNNQEYLAMNILSDAKWFIIKQSHFICRKKRTRDYFVYSKIHLRKNATNTVEISSKFVVFFNTIYIYIYMCMCVCVECVSTSCDICFL